MATVKETVRLNTIPDKVWLFVIEPEKLMQWRTYIKMKLSDVDKLITDGPYSMVRHPNFTGIIFMNIAYLFFFRTLWLIPPICVFFVLWYFEARHEERILIAKFGESYRNYMKTTGMFFSRPFKSKSYDRTNE